MKKIFVLAILLISICACSKENDDFIAKIKPRELSDETKSIIELFADQNINVYNIKINSDQEILQSFNLYLFKDGKWEKHTLISGTDQKNDFDVVFNLIDRDNEYLLGIGKINDDYNTPGYYKTDIEYDVINKMHGKAYSFLENEVNVKLDDEIIIYNLLASNDETLITYDSIYIDDFMKQKDLDYEAGILITVNYKLVNN